MTITSARGILIGLLPTFVAWFILPVFPVHAEMMRITTIGDSITQADADRGADGGYSYRYWLWRMFVDAGIEVDFVGSQNLAAGSGDPGWPNHNGMSFDRDHEGHFSQSTQFIRNNLPGWLTGYDADVAMVHIGHNDGWQGIDINDTRNNIVTLIGTLQSDNPNIIVLLAKVIPSNPNQPPEGSSFPLSHINALNSLMDSIAADTTTATSPVHVVDINTGFDPPTMIYDGVHPNASGEQFMADRWFAAYQALVIPQPTTGWVCLVLLGWFAMSKARQIATNRQLGCRPPPLHTNSNS